MRVMFWYPNDAHAVHEMPAVPRVGERIEAPSGIEYAIRDVLWTLQPTSPTGASVTVFLR